MYRELPPPSYLADLVECAWVLVPGHDRNMERILPDGCADLVATPNHLEIWVPASAAVVAPPVYYPRVGLRFRPGGVRILLGAAPQELRDHRVSVADLLGSDCTALEDCTREIVCRSLLSRNARDVEQLFRALARRRRDGRPDRLVRAALRELERDPAQRVRALARGFDISERQLHRRFEVETGLGVKRMARILRFQRLLARMRCSTAADNWADAAYELGFSDQAHLNHETKALSGLSPAALRKELRSAR
jgi:AraC-like DNA-binding protein